MPSIDGVMEFAGDSEWKNTRNRGCLRSNGWAARY
jgi:hypothetical protein